MKYMKSRSLAAALSGVFMAAAVSTASATLVLVAPEEFSGTGLGSVNTVLTIQSPGSTSSEQGCVGRSALGCPGGTPNGAGDFIGGTLGGNELTGASQTQTLSADAIGILSAADIRVVFNALEPGGPGGDITLETLVLNIYSSTGTLEFTSGAFTPTFFADTFTGAGNAGFVFALDAAQAAAAQLVLSPGDLLGLSASASDATGGFETFFIAQTETQVPEPGSLLLLAAGLAGLGFSKRKKAKKS